MKTGDYSHITTEQYRNFKYQKFVRDYDLFMLNQVHMRYLALESDEIREQTTLKEIEVTVIKELNQYFLRRMDILTRYYDHCWETNKENLIETKKFKLYHDHLKVNFLTFKLSHIDDSQKLAKLYFKNTKPIERKSLVNGKTLNLLDRFNLANELLDLEKNIRKLNIQDLEKYELVSIILGCDKDNARNLMNNRYNAKPNDLQELYDKLNLPK
ncbi:hypothetical protein ACPDHL_11965 [Myroides sp. C15-4]|uniref:hypothetical protein n=1 Tax=Myroides sp. C15-4 TaxID=3400532 RepID=UPI003D2F60B2